MKIRLRFIIVDVPAGLDVGADGCSVIDLPDGQAVDMALASFSLPSEETYLTLVNDESIPVDDRSARHLQEGDLLTIFSPLKGG